MRYMRLTALAAVFVFLTVTAIAQLDSTFGTNGTATAIFSPLDSRSERIAAMPDGKVLAAGRATGLGSYANAVLVRFTANGNLDQTFGRGGRSVLYELEAVTSIVDLAIAPNGKILVLGLHPAAGPASNTNAFVARFTDNGEEDHTFGTGGKIIIDRDANDEVLDLEVQQDGKFFIGGVIRRTGFQPYGYLARYNTDGSVDTGFANGLYIVPMPNNPDYLFSAVTTIKAISPTEIFVGSQWFPVGTDIAWMTKLNGQGTAVASFGTNGISTWFTDLPGPSAGYAKYTILPNGKIALTARQGYNVFSANGVFEIGVGYVNNIVGGVSGIAFMPTGEIVLRDNFSRVSNPNSEKALIRLDASGRIRGYLTHNPQTDFSSLPFAIAADRRILFAGASGSNFAVTRYLRIPNIRRNRDADFNGDGRADFAVCRRGITVSACYLYQPSGGFLIAHGTAGPKTLSEDYTGDGAADVTHWLAGINGQGVFSGYQFGATQVTNPVFQQSFGTFALDTPLGGDYDGDRLSDYAIYRNGLWSIMINRTQNITGYQWGIAGDKPVPRDYDGDGLSDIAIYRPSTGQWAILRSSDRQAVVTQFGIAEDKPVPGDYDGDGRDDIAVYRPSAGTWYINGSTDGFFARQFGIASDRPVPADYDGDTKTDVAVFRNGAWYVNGSMAGFIYTQWGTTGDIPLTTAYSAE